MKSLVNDSFVFHAARNSDKIRNDLDENNQVISTKHAINRPCSTVRLQVCFQCTIAQTAKVLLVTRSLAMFPFPSTADFLQRNGQRPFCARRLALFV